MLRRATVLRAIRTSHSSIISATTIRIPVLTTTTTRCIHNTQMTRSFFLLARQWNRKSNQVAALHVIEALRVRPLQTTVRFFGNKRNRTKTTHFNDLDLKAIPFTEEPQQALESFHEWCSSHGILFRGDTKIEAQYLPFWTFDINVRYTTLAANGYNTTTNVRPAPFDSAYKNKNNKNNTIHLQGISAYAGYNYRRKLVNPVHSSTVLFLGNDKIQEFLGWMLDPLPYLHTGMEVNLDTWNASKGRAFAVVVEDLRNLAMDDAQFLKKIKDFDVDVEVLNAQRVYMPTFVITYSIFGVEYRAFVSGCDPNTTVSGISHSAFASSTSETIDTATGIVARGAHSLFRHVTQVVGFSYALNSLHRPMLWLTKSILGVVSRFPIVTAAAGGFALYRKFMRPYLEHVVSKDEWEKQREREAGGMQDDYAWSHRNSFRDDGSAKAYFERNREAILRHLSGEGSADQPKSNFYTFYQQFEEYQRAAERQGREEYNAYREQEWFEEQTRGFYSEYGEKNKSQGKKKRTKQQQATTNVSMEQDPYDLLGVKRGATKEEVSRAFRKEMMRYHPDALPFASEEEKRRSTERSKQITEAYREIKNSMRGK